jgi:hypothetical protein
MRSQDTTDFSTLFHAYGRATDTPAHLTALADGDSTARTAAVQHLGSAVMHQGTPWTATGPTAVAVARLLDDPRLSSAEDAPLRGELLEFLADVAAAVNEYADDPAFAQSARTDWDRFDADLPARFEALLDETEGDEEGAVEALFGDDEEFADQLLARGFVGCAQAVVHLLGPVLRRLDDPDPQVRHHATDAGRQVLLTWQIAVRLALVPDEQEPTAAGAALAARLDNLPEASDQVRD